MSPAVPAHLRALAFGTLDGSLWAVVVDRGEPALVLGTDGSSPAAEAIAHGLSWGPETDAWTLSGDGVALTVTPAAVPVAEPSSEGPEPQAPPEGPADQQLCRVTGTVTIAGAQRAVDCVGTRLRAEGKPVDTAATARLTAAWFSAAEAIELLALRPGKANDHEHEAVAATVFDPDRWIPVADPRLSTTYDGDGTPRRAGLELWITDGEHEYPRRIAGEVERAGAAASAPGLRLRVAPLRCHSRGQDGSGVYVLADFAAD